MKILILASFLLIYAITMTKAYINPIVRIQLPLFKEIFNECQKANGTLYFGGFLDLICLTSPTNVIDFSDTTEIVGTNSAINNVIINKNSQYGFNLGYEVDTTNYYTFKYDDENIVYYKWPLCSKDDPEYNHAECMKAASKMSTVRDINDSDLIYEAISCIYGQANLDFSKETSFYYNLKNDGVNTYDYLCLTQNDEYNYRFGHCKINGVITPMVSFTEEQYQHCAKARNVEVPNPLRSDFKPIIITKYTTMVTVIPTTTTIATTMMDDNNIIQPTPPCQQAAVTITEKIKETITEKVKETETVTETIKETITEKIKETVTEKINETVTITIVEKPTSKPEIQCADKWAQCGGSNFKGPTCCKPGSVCYKYNKFYSLCI
ncbi:hypothetical protein BCR32DRAFT_128451 [Anaeromyces robustus]|uniref:CBM1 domain-containing protein n=1 Tax=Anaeromyces robustus TaxID=1754192 RepID=A0A1Y1VTA8_9FUNG|nr:hypothetical protein BCR32DRAFT_128451 [Anaeromyces robustus]|eukprot:ORX64518.1 hypothetical protein BCR32DRAFT_128451 [Anaeromyces robustus]